jgi:hypothetical protein
MPCRHSTPRASPLIDSGDLSNAVSSYGQPGGRGICPAGGQASTEQETELLRSVVTAAPGRLKPMA